MNSVAKSRWPRRVLRNIVLYGLAGGVLITILRLTEYRFLVVGHSVEIYSRSVAATFSALGIWLGLPLTKKKQAPHLRKPFVFDQQRQGEREKWSY